MQKEFGNLLSAIDKWVEASDCLVSFVGSFVSYDQDKIEKDEEDITKDCIIVGYGGKGEVKIQLKELSRLLKEDKEELINW